MASSRLLSETIGPERYRSSVVGPITHAPHRFNDIAGFPELLAEAAHMRVNRSGFEVSGIIPNIFQ
jgi:hypothetical protein